MPPKKRAGKPKTGGSAPAAIGLPVCVAIFPCDNVIIGEDKTVSAIRICDTINLPAAGTFTDGQGLDFAPIRFFVLLKKGESQGAIPVLLSCVDPQGRAEPVAAAEVVFEGGPESGAHLNASLRVHWGGPGVYWLELRANDTLIARTPLRVNKPE